MAEVFPADDGVGAYKAVLREVLERRPSGMRQRLAEALGTTRSFVSQISNPAYATPIPAQYVANIFEICHFSDTERLRFMTAYRRAHPRRGGAVEDAPEPTRSLVLEVPDLGSDVRNAEFDAIVQEMVARLKRLTEIKDR
ncbi:hypothetical protein [Chthonobacter albigriseus]|uniref:hypothetical protein n=1 Tax=Chthonobacter albigriseus TaxID=1683161 RepID=UPI0015EF1AD0|nr:hypothetical protein [Chthonobacter albigriseus]